MTVELVVDVAAVGGRGGWLVPFAAESMARVFRVLLAALPCILDSLERAALMWMGFMHRCDSPTSCDSCSREVAVVMSRVSRSAACRPVSCSVVVSLVPPLLGLPLRKKPLRLPGWWGWVWLGAVCLYGTETSACVCVRCVCEKRTIRAVLL